jgi:hypothetical protein
MIYTDRIHIISDQRGSKGFKELHEFAEVLGLNAGWFDSNPRHQHYDFPKRQSGGISRDQLIEDSLTLGAYEVSTRELVIISQTKIQ